MTPLEEFDPIHHEQFSNRFHNNVILSLSLFLANVTGNMIQTRNDRQFQGQLPKCPVFHSLDFLF